MSVHSNPQLPLSLRLSNKRDMRLQFGALCYRVQNDRPEILLITSRRSRRWIVPKGWPMENVTPADTAMTEAWEEAGVKGRSFGQCLGLFTYVKLGDHGEAWPCGVMLYPVRVKSLADKYPEMDERKRRWFRPKKAASLVDEPDLKAILRNFDPRQIRR